MVSDGQSYPIPCACGDDSIRVKRIAFVAPYFRVMQCLISWAVIVSLFPAHAGVIPAPRESTPSTVPIPCVCGGVQSDLQTANRGEAYSLRMRGCSSCCCCACAGCGLFPCVCRGDPISALRASFPSSYSPRCGGKDNSLICIFQAI